MRSADDYVLGRYVLTPMASAPWVPAVARVEGSGIVTVLGVMPPTMSADQSIALGHRLVEAGLGARRTDA